MNHWSIGIENVNNGDERSSEDLIEPILCFAKNFAVKFPP